jgi:tripartite-type tricarboxylate transporter receptor subunit TctC
LKRGRDRLAAAFCFLNGHDVYNVAVKLAENAMRRALQTMALLAATASPLAARADAISDFYAGKTLNIVVGSDAGGTYDYYGRTIARHIGKHLPGKPSAIVQNLAGAGSYLAFRRVFNVAPQDGTVLGSIGAALPYQSLIDPGAPPFEADKVKWLPSISSYNMVMLVRADVPVRSWEDLRTRPVVQASIAPGQANSLIIAAVNDALGAKIKGIAGHKSLNEAMLALERGEIEGYPAMPVDVLKRNHARDMEAGKFRLLLQFGAAPLPEYPDVPWAPGLASDPASRMVLDLTTGFLRTGYVYMMGPDVPRERVAAMRKALMETFADPEFLEDAKRQTLTIAPVPAERVTQLFAEAYATPPEIVARLRKLFAQGQ